MKATAKIVLFCIGTMMACNTTKTTKVYYEVGAPILSKEESIKAKKVDSGYNQYKNKPQSQPFSVQK